MLALTDTTQRIDASVDIFFKSNKLAKVLNEEARLKKEYGAKNGKQIRLRLAVLAAAPTLADVPTQPPDRCHQLKADRKGCFAVDAEHPFRIVFEPNHDPMPLKEDGGVDLRKVTAITILEIVDYH
jgi:proteic killer suppression protein